MRFFLPISALPGSIERLIDALQTLPGIGRKTASRLAFFLLKKTESDRQRLGNAVLEATKNLQKCVECGHFSEREKCGICEDPFRDSSVICVVEDSLDLIALEKTRAFRGKYHVLGGAIAPLDGVGPEDLSLDALVARLESGEVTEVILATNPTLEGEATAAFLRKKCVNFTGTTTRLARGIPVGGDVEYADEVTLTRAFENRSMF